MKVPLRVKLWGWRHGWITLILIAFNAVAWVVAAPASSLPEYEARLAPEIAELREKVGHGAEKQERHQLFERFHPRSGLGQPGDESGLDTDQQIGRGHPEADGHDDQNGLRRRESQRRAKDVTQQRPTARCRKDGCKHAFGKRPDQPLTVLQFQRCSTAGHPGHWYLPDTQIAKR